MQQLKNRLKNRFRPFAEQLETRLTPAFTGSINFNPNAGTLSVVGTDNSTTFTVAVTAPNTVTITDGAGLNNSYAGVTSNLTVNVATTNIGAFTGSLSLGVGGTATSLLGNVNLTFSRSSGGGADVNTQVLNSTDGSAILGRTTLTTNNTGLVNVDVFPGRTTSFTGGLTINTSNPTATNIRVNPSSTATTINGLTVNAAGGNLGVINKVFQMGVAGGGPITLNGNVAVTGIDTATLGNATPLTLNGNVNVTTRNNTVGGSAVTLGGASVALSNVTVAMGNNGTLLAPDTASFAGSIFGGLFVNLGNGTNTLNANAGTTFVAGIISINGASGNNTVNLGNGAGSSFASTSIIFSAGNGNNTLNLDNIQAGNAALTVSVGNGTNAVHFGTTAALRSASLIGGLGLNTFDGTINFPLKTYRFS